MPMRPHLLTGRRTDMTSAAANAAPINNGWHVRHGIPPLTRHQDEADARPNAAIYWTLDRRAAALLSFQVLVV